MKRCLSKPRSTYIHFTGSTRPSWKKNRAASADKRRLVALTGAAENGRRLVHALVVGSAARVDAVILLDQTHYVQGHVAKVVQRSMAVTCRGRIRSVLSFVISRKARKLFKEQRFLG